VNVKITKTKILIFLLIITIIAALLIIGFVKPDKLFKVNQGYPEPILLKNGNLLITGVDPPQIFDPVKNKIYDMKNNNYLYGQFLLLPDGNVLVVNDRLWEVYNKGYGVYDIDNNTFIDKDFNLPIFSNKDWRYTHGNCSDLTLLENDDILISGCIDFKDDGYPRKHNYIYNYENNTYKQIADLNRPREDDARNSVIQLKNKNVLIIPPYKDQYGGSLSENAIAELYDYKTNKFKVVNKLKNNNPILLDNGKILLLEDYIDGLKANIYDPEKQTFKIVAKTNYSRSRDFGAVKLKDGKILIVGGFVSLGTKEYVETSDLEWIIDIIKDRIIGQTGHIIEIFDPKTNEFKTVGKIIETRTSYVKAVELNDGNIAVFGVSDTYSDPYEGFHSTTMEIFDIPNGSNS